MDSDVRDVIQRSNKAPRVQLLLQTILLVRRLSVLGRCDRHRRVGGPREVFYRVTLLGKRSLIRHPRASVVGAAISYSEWSSSRQRRRSSVPRRQYLHPIAALRVAVAGGWRRARGEIPAWRESCTDARVGEVRGQHRRQRLRFTPMIEIKPPSTVTRPRLRLQHERRQPPLSALKCRQAPQHHRETPRNMFGSGSRSKVECRVTTAPALVQAEPPSLSANRVGLRDPPEFNSRAACTR